MKKLSKLKISKSLPLLLATALVLTISAGHAFADSKPFFYASDSDIFAGGWFGAGASCTGANYQGPSYSPLTGQYKGAIMSFFDANNRPGAASNLGAFSLGYLETDQTAANLYGFKSGKVSAGPLPNGTRSLSFSNSASDLGSNWGGLFNGSGGPNSNNCIPDYYSDRISDASPTGSINVSAASGTYRLSAGGSPVTVAGDTVPNTSGNRGNIAFFVDGDVYIDHNIYYGAHTASTSPKFAIVARGNIYIDPVVTELNGWYIAQPNGTTGGVIWTCHDSSSAQPTDKWTRTNCINNKLTVNGSLTSKQVNLGRVSGDLGGTSAELINYTPEMVVGGPFFDQQPSITAPLQSLISLPPVF